MSISTLPLAYCTNVHPGRSADEVIAGIETYSAKIADSVGGDLAVGLWFARPVATELLEDSASLERLTKTLAEHRLPCYTLNAFPFGDFHAERVKRDVYKPDWTDPERFDYTRDCAKLLAEIMPEGVEGSISTVPLGYADPGVDEAFLDLCRQRLIALAESLDELHEETGRVIRLAIEPEPFCLIETTPQACEFFESLVRAAEEQGKGDIVRQHIGLCYDVCHQAVEFEDVSESIRSIADAGIRINKVQISCAIRLEQPADAELRRELSQFAEPKYLHQTFAASEGKVVTRASDLSGELCESPEKDFESADEWRVHFHVPVNAERVGRLGTTRPQLVEALQAVAELEYAPHLEIETYTWPVMRAGEATDIADGIADEVTAVRAMLGMDGDSENEG